MGILTNFTYQLQLRGPDVEAKIQGRDQLRKFLNAMYGGQGPNGEAGFKMRGPLNWYRTRVLNHEDDLQDLVNVTDKIKVPSLFIAASRDAALPPAMSKSMNDQFEDLSREEVDATHWALVEKGDDVNRIVTEWLEKKTESKASL
ncbi:hypothetical protein NLG97_g9524 [Lecanicillium saksenae]|uniref:Uncharacterized protein n=1 Tax=Lecanicillium saksenae TaxID=468837 RepID=A0ACC1QFT3_9HYPO|nr:hypothetical protein NLG97_g9524 [Lecanicillium saksenae]